MMNKKTKKNLFIVLIIICIVIVSAIVFFVGKKLDKPTNLTNVAVIAKDDLYNYLINFEDLKYISNQTNITKDKAFSGSKSGFVKEFDSFSPAVIIPIPTNDSTEIDNVNVKFWLCPTTEIINTILVFSVLDQNNNQVLWEAFPIEGNNFAKGNWYNFNKQFEMPNKFVNSSFSLKIYLWNKDPVGAVVYIDDISVNLKESNEMENPRTRLIDFETTSDKKLSSKYAKSGFYSTYAKGKDDFSATVVIPLDELNTKDLKTISLSFSYLSETKDLNAVFVVSVCDKDNKDVLWYGIDLAGAEFVERKWETANGIVAISQDVLKSGSYIKFYLWNRNENQVYVDDIYLVIKESEIGKDSVEPAYNFLESDVFQPKANHPPYDFRNVNLENIAGGKELTMNSIFTKNSRVLSGKFDSRLKNEQILVVKHDGSNLFSFDALKLKSVNVKFSPAIKQNYQIYSNKSFVFAFDPIAKKVLVYNLNSRENEFKMRNEIEINNIQYISNIICPASNTISIIESSGKITDFYLNEGTYSEGKTTKLINPDNGNLKSFLADFFKIKSENLLCIYTEKSSSKYVFLKYDEKTKAWTLSHEHSNKSIQSDDLLDFAADYYIVDYDKNGVAELLQFSKNKIFSLRVINFDSMTYNIVCNIEFKGFKKKQNPKYYEISRIISGNFVGDAKSEIIIFQDNVSKVDWLTQKTEMYSFGK